MSDRKDDDEAAGGAQVGESMTLKAALAATSTPSMEPVLAGMSSPSMKAAMSAMSGMSALSAAGMSSPSMKAAMSAMSGMSALSAAGVSSPSMKAAMSGISGLVLRADADLIISTEVNLRLAEAGLVPRVAPTSFAAVDSLVRAETASVALPEGEWTEAERASMRRVAQVVVSVIVCAEMAGIALSANDVVKVILTMMGSMSLVTPGINVGRLTGKVFDMLWPPSP